MIKDQCSDGPITCLKMGEYPAVTKKASDKLKNKFHFPT